MEDFIGGNRVGPWADNASCRGIDGEMFYPELATTEAIATAKRVCQHCPVQPQCLEHAIQYNEQHGIWGGTTPTERARLQRGIKRVTRATALGIQI